MNGRWELLKNTKLTAVCSGGLPETAGTGQPGAFASGDCPRPAMTARDGASPAKASRSEERQGAPQQTAGDRGFALVFTLLLLSMMSLIALAMVLSSSSDMLINGYYRNARGSFYAADSGLSIAREQLLEQIMTQVKPTFSSNPIPLGADATACATVLNMYAAPTSLNAGQAGNSWTEKFAIPNSTNCCGLSCTQQPMLSIAPNSPTPSSYDSNNNPNGYQYIYNYNLSVTGMAEGSEQTTVSETGSFILAITGQQASTTISFAIYGAWVDQYPDCLGALNPGTMTGPMFTNGAWEFMTGGPYIFTDPVGQTSANADFWFGDTCIDSPTSSYTYQSSDSSAPQTISPTFEGNPPFSLGQPYEPSPLNSFNQMWAVLDSMGTGEGPSAPTPAQMNAGNLSGSSPPYYPPLQTSSGTAYPQGGPSPDSSGVYFPYTTSGGVSTFDGGGFYVEGGGSSGTTFTSVLLSTSGSSAQVLTISQTTDSSTTTTTITTDPLASPPTAWNCPAGITSGTTTVTTQVGSSPPTTVNFCSVPMNLVPTPAQPGTMLYVNGNITSLSGTGEGIPAVQDGSQITIVANGEIDITGDVVYKTEPVTTTDNQIVSPTCCNGDPMTTLIPGNDKNQVLGIFTANGNIQMSSPYQDSNLEVDASLAALQQGSQWCFTTPQGTAFINTFNNVGGQIQSGICGQNIGTQNTYFDRRFTSRPGFAPPWFPSTTVTSTGASPAQTKPTIQRVQWLLKNM